ncbi:MAG: DNA gyrase inhibitor YacG [Pseudomonadales bacterium]
MSSEQPPRILQCPNCKASVAWTASNAHRPFCSERCKLIDFGDWADERHSIPGRSETDERFSEDNPKP